MDIIINQSSIQISSSIRFEPPFLPYQCVSKSALLFAKDSQCKWSVSQFINLTDYPVLPSSIIAKDPSQPLRDIEYIYGGAQDGYAIYNEVPNA